MIKISEIILGIFLLSLISLNVKADTFETKLGTYSLFDSLLNNFSEKKITTQVKRNLDFYEVYGTDNSFVEVFFKNNDYMWYDFRSFTVKPDDPNFIIHGLGGIKTYEDEFDKCLWMFDFETLHLAKYSDLEKIDTYEGSHPFDPSGKSFLKQSFYENKDGINIEIQCADFDQSVQNENDNADFFGFYIYTDEISNWKLAE
jgi:hypothetical protein